MAILQGISFSPGIDKMQNAAVHGLHTNAVRQHLHDRLKVATLRGVTIKAIDNALQNYDDWALEGFLLWLQDQLKDWSNPEPDVYRPQIQSFCDRLRNRHLEDKHIINSFQLWKSVQAKIDGPTQSRILLIEDVIYQYLDNKKKGTPTPLSHPPLRHIAGPDLDKPLTKQPHKPTHSVKSFTNKSLTSQQNTITMSKNDIIEISSDGECSEVEFLGTKGPNDRPGHQMKENKTKPKSSSLSVAKYPQKTLDGAYDNEHCPLVVMDKRESNVEYKAGKPNKGRYICNRCHKPGHDLKDCPTNIDPSYDTPPPAGYICTWCSAEEKHYATLCPRNRNADSWNQLRIKAGINTKPDLPKGDSYRPSYNQSKTADPERGRKLTETRDAGLMHSGRLSMMRQGADYDVPVDGFRNTERKRSYSRQQSPLEDQRSCHKEGDQSSLPPHKKFRQDDQERDRDLSYIRGRGRGNERGLEWDNRRGREHRVRFVSPAASRMSSGNQGTFDLVLPPLHNNGRLSYWDDGYESPDPRGLPSKLESPYRTERSPEPQSLPKPTIPVFSSSPLRMNNRPSSVGFWSDGNGDVEKEIKARFPDADPTWVRDMASFDVDTFFDEMDDFMAARGTFQGGQEMPLGMDTVTEVATNGPHLNDAHVDVKEFQRGISEEGGFVEGPQGEIGDESEVAETGDVQVKIQGSTGRAGVKLNDGEADIQTVVCGGDEIFVSQGDQDFGRESCGDETVASIGQIPASGVAPVTTETMDD